MDEKGEKNSGEKRESGGDSSARGNNAGNGTAHGSTPSRSFAASTRTNGHQVNKSGDEKSASVVGNRSSSRARASLENRSRARWRRNRNRRETENDLGQHAEAIDNTTSNEPQVVEAVFHQDNWRNSSGISFSIVISGIAESSPFKDSPLKVGYELVSINGVSCESCQPNDCMEMMKEAEGDLKIVARELDSSVGMIHGTEMPQQNLIDCGDVTSGVSEDAENTLPDETSGIDEDSGVGVMTNRPDCGSNTVSSLENEEKDEKRSVGQYHQEHLQSERERFPWKFDSTSVTTSVDQGHADESIRDPQSQSTAQESSGTSTETNYHEEAQSILVSEGHREFSGTPATSVPNAVAEPISVIPENTSIVETDCECGDEPNLSSRSADRRNSVRRSGTRGPQRPMSLAPGAYSMRGSLMGRRRRRSIAQGTSAWTLGSMRRRNIQGDAGGSLGNESQSEVYAVALDEAEFQQRVRQDILGDTIRAEVVDSNVRRRYILGWVLCAMVLVGVTVGLTVGLTNRSDGESVIFVDVTPSPTWTTESPTVSPTEVPRPTLETVLERGKLRCGLRDYAPFYAYNNETGLGEGFEVDLCHAISAAIFGGNDSRVEIVIVEISNQRFEYLGDRSVDLVLSLATHTIERDIYQGNTENGFAFSSPYLYDGLRFAGVPPFASCADNLSSYDGQCRKLRVCVGEFTSHFPVVQDLFPISKIVPSIDANIAIQDFIDGTCNAFAGERNSVSEQQLRALGYEGEYEVGTNVYSKEPLAAVTRDDDEEWSDFVNWVLQALVAAEEQGISHEESALLPTVSVFGDRFEKMFIDAIAAVGNYGEIYGRHLEAFFPRQGLNTINVNGSTGLLYSHSFGGVEVIGPGPSKGGTMEKIESRGHLRCGITVRDGFGVFDSNTGNWSGLDAYYCYTLSAGIFNDTSGSTVFVDLPTIEDGYVALAIGDIDVLSGASLNLVTDVLEPVSMQGFSFSQPYFYDPPTGATFDLASRDARALATRQDDSQWSGFVYWMVASTFYAEENFVSQSESSEMPLVNLFGTRYQRMFRNAISAVGNYGEMYARDVEAVVPRTGRNLLNVNPFGPQLYPLPGL